MDLFSELVSTVQSDSNVSSNSSLFTPTKVKSTINRAYIKVGALFRWPALNDSLVASTGVNKLYYDAPQNWQPNSMWRLEIDGNLYGEEPDGNPMSYPDFLTWKLNNPNATEKKWAVQWLRYFINPISTSVGSNNISVWGQKNVTPMVNDSDTTIFSYNSPECNEAVVLEAIAMLKKKGEDAKTGLLYSVDAQAILARSYKKITQESSKSEKIAPMFDTPNFFANSRQSSKNIIGNFRQY